MLSKLGHCAINFFAVPKRNINNGLPPVREDNPRTLASGLDYYTYFIVYKQRD